MQNPAVREFAKGALSMVGYFGTTTVLADQTIRHPSSRYALLGPTLGGLTGFMLAQTVLRALGAAQLPPGDPWKAGSVVGVASCMLVRIKK